MVELCKQRKFVIKQVDKSKSQRNQSKWLVVYSLYMEQRNYAISGNMVV